LIPILLLSFKSNERLTGKYFNHTSNYRLESYDFKSNGEFEYYAECEYKLYGHGHYFLKQDSLILTYLNYESKEKGHFDIWGNMIESQNSDTINFRIQDSKSNELLNDVTIHYLGTQIGKLTNENGQTKVVRLDKDIEIVKLGYNSITISKDKIMDKDILGFNIFLQDGLIYFRENLNDTLQIEIIDTDTLMLDKSLFVKDIKSKQIILCE
jgi:hypothetical protein